MRSLSDAPGRERTAAVTTAASERRTGRSLPPAADTFISRIAQGFLAKLDRGAIKSPERQPPRA